MDTEIRSRVRRELAAGEPLTAHNDRRIQTDLSLDKHKKPNEKTTCHASTCASQFHSDRHGNRATNGV